MISVIRVVLRFSWDKNLKVTLLFTYLLNEELEEESLYICIHEYIYMNSMLNFLYQKSMSSYPKKNKAATKRKKVKKMFSENKVETLWTYLKNTTR